MKKLLTTISLSVCVFLFSQTSLPQTSSKGTIVTKTNQTIEFRNLKFEKGKITYTDKNTNAEEFLYDNSVKSMSYYDNDGNLKSYEAQEMIADNISGNVFQQNNHITEPEKIINKPAKLGSDKEIISYLIQNRNQDYLKGQKLNNLGTGFLIGGGACVVIGAVINLNSGADEPTITNQKPESKGSPIPIIIGLVGMGAGAVMKISGHSQMKKAVNNYKTAGINKINPAYFALADNKGLGLQIKF